MRAGLVVGMVGKQAGQVVVRREKLEEDEGTRVDLEQGEEEGWVVRWGLVRGEEVMGGGEKRCVYGGGT